MAKSTSVAIMSASGSGRKDRNSALAAELFETLASTHGNSAQAASLHAIIERAAERYARKVARKAAKVAKDEPVAKVAKVTRKSSAKVAKARTTEVAEDAAVAADLPARESFVARMRALAAANEAEGVRV